MERGAETQMQAYRQMLNDIHAINAEIRPLLTRTVLISLNAEIASAKLGQLGQPFSVVAREMGKISGMLGGLMQDVEGTIQRAVQQIAHWFQASKRMELLGQSLHLLLAETGDPAALLAPAEEPAPPAERLPAPLAPGEPEAEAALAAPLSAECDRRGFRVKGHLQDMELEMANLLTNVSDRTRDLHGLLEGMSNSVGRESRYLGLFAKIEAAHINHGEASLSGVAMAIQDLATQIDGALATAKARIVA